MTIAKLKNILDGFDDDLLVVVDGYEGGADTLVAEEVEMVSILENCNPEEYYGDHAYLSNNVKNSINALRLGRIGGK